MDISKSLEQFIQEQIIKGQKDIDLQQSTNLIEEGIIDSLGIMKLLTFIEENYNLEISDEELAEIMRFLPKMAVRLTRELVRYLPGFGPSVSSAQSQGRE